MSYAFGFRKVKLSANSAAFIDLESDYTFCPGMNDTVGSR